MPESPDDLLTIMYDPINRKVGCVIMQGIYGCNPEYSHWWDTKRWEVGNPLCLRKLQATRQQWKTLAEIDSK